MSDTPKTFAEFWAGLSDDPSLPDDYALAKAFWAAGREAADQALRARLEDRAMSAHDFAMILAPNGAHQGGFVDCRSSSCEDTRALLGSTEEASDRG